MSHDDTDDAVDAMEVSKLTEKLSKVMVGHPWDISAAALCELLSVVLVNTEEEGGLQAKLILYAGIMMTLYEISGKWFEYPREAMVLGDGSGVSSEAVKKGIELCPALDTLIIGLGEHREGKDVLNAWLSAGLNYGIHGLGVDAMRAVLQACANGLSQVEEETRRRAEMDSRANVSDVGRA